MLSAIIFLRFSPTPEEASKSRAPGVSIEPGLTAFTRMRRAFKSVVHVRANERTAALVALQAYSCIPLIFIKASDCEDDPAEGAAFYQATQSISRFGQREGLSHDRFDRAGLKQGDDSVPGVSPGRLRLSEQYEALDAGPFPDQICDVNGCLASGGIA